MKEETEDAQEGESEEKADSGDAGDDRQMHKATCAECGKECEVPFAPTGDRPVYCQECYQKRRPRRSFGFGGGRDNRGPRTMHKATCAECGKECEVPFKPTGDKPVLCQDCYRKSK
jgi:CxxC-x17-CxxC domain-containing protein